MLRKRHKSKRFRAMPVTEVIVVAGEGVTVLDVSVDAGVVTPIGITHVVTGVAYHDADELETLVTGVAVEE
jgi:hypothetical protein